MTFRTQVQAVKFLDIALGFDKVPLADWCERRVTCSYEEVTTGLFRRPAVPSRHRRGPHQLKFGPMSS